MTIRRTTRREVLEILSKKGKAKVVRTIPAYSYLLNPRKRRVKDRETAWAIAKALNQNPITPYPTPHIGGS